MQTTLENLILKVTFDTRGAETISIFNKLNKTEVLWQGDKEIYEFQSPVMFPFTGRLKNGIYTYEGVEYYLPLHGFAKDSEFTITEQTKTHVVFLLTDTPLTLKIYPFKFNFFVKYELKENLILTTYIVKNIDNKLIYFGVGGHPGFILPNIEKRTGTNIDGNKLVFEHEEFPEILTFQPDEILIQCSKPYGPFKEIPLSKSLFSVDALLFKNIKSRYVTLQKCDGSAIKIWLRNCPYLAFWTHKTKGSFLCVEPWCGLPDYYEPICELKNKEGINCLAPEKIFEYSYCLEVL